MIKVIADMDIPYLQGVLEPYAHVEYMKGKNIDAMAAKGADALLVRTRTRCDKSLLEGSQVQFVATATIGIDHINTAELDALGIKYCNAPGCNAASVKNYIASALAAQNRDLTGTLIADIVLQLLSYVAQTEREFIKQRQYRFKTTKS